MTEETLPKLEVLLPWQTSALTSKSLAGGAVALGMMMNKEEQDAITETMHLIMTTTMPLNHLAVNPSVSSRFDNHQA